MSSCGVVGVNWGDEGKGRMVDLLSRDYEIVVRYQGGNNAGHTVVSGKKKYVMNLLPSGILRKGTVNILGPGMVIDLEHINKDIVRFVYMSKKEVGGGGTFCGNLKDEH